MTNSRQTMRMNEQAAVLPPAAAGTERWALVVAALAAGLCWAGALALLLLANLHAEADLLAPQRLLFYILVIGAGLLMFIPVEKTLRLPGLTVEGVGGTFVLLYTLAFVPPPTDWLLALPDMPIYMLFFAALFWTTSALLLPFVYALGQRFFRHRARRMDVRRARRQAYEIGALTTSIAMMASLGVLTWVSVLLVVLILVIAELMFLSLVKVNLQQGQH